MLETKSFKSQESTTRPKLFSSKSLCAKKKRLTLLKEQFTRA